MPVLYESGEIKANKKDEGKLKLRIDADEFALKNGCLYIGVKTKLELGDIYVPDNTKFTFPGIAIINFDDKQEGQKFVLNALKDALEPGKVYKGWVSIDDSLEMAKKANAGSETHKNVLLEESFNLIPNDAPEVIKDVNSLEAPKGFQKGGKPYNPMAKWEAFSKITGLEGNLFEISIVVSEMPDNQRHAFLEMLKAVL